MDDKLSIHRRVRQDLQCSYFMDVVRFLQSPSVSFRSFQQTQFVVNISFITSNQAYLLLMQVEIFFKHKFLCSSLAV